MKTTVEPNDILATTYAGIVERLPGVLEPALFARVKAQFETRNGLPLLLVEVDGKPCFLNYAVSDERSGHSQWTRKPTGLWRLIVGGYGDRCSLPPRKDGSYNWDTIMRHAVKAITLKARQNDREALQAGNAGAVARLKAEFNLDESSQTVSARRVVQGVRELHEYVAPAGTVFVDLKLTLTETKARKLLALVQELQS